MSTDKTIQGIVGKGSQQINHKILTLATTKLSVCSVGYPINTATKRLGLSAPPCPLKPIPPLGHKSFVFTYLGNKCQ